MHFAGSTMIQVDKRRFLFIGREPWLVLGLATFAIHLIFNAGYGIFRDELYFIVCGDRSAWGYVDQPPLIPFLASWSHALFGNFLIGFRLIPALALSATVALSAVFARTLAGGRFAQWLTGLCVLFSPQFLAIGLLFTTDTFQPLTWLACGWFLVRLAQTGDERWWIPFGLVLGASLLSKYAIAFYVVVLGIGLLATPERRSLKRPWLYAGALVGATLVLPNVLWQQAHGWPFLELGKAAVNGKNVALSPVAFLVQQLLLIGPLAAPVWVAGLWASSLRPKLAVYRAFPIAYVILFVFFIVSHGKAYYMTPIYPTLLAIGAVAIESWLQSPAWRRVRRAALTSVTISGVIAAPMAIPVLSEKAFISYSRVLGIAPSATAADHQKLGLLPQNFADQHGWPEMAAQVAAVYNALSPADREKAVFLGIDYGEAAAIDIFGRPLGLPPAISGHNNYYLWGPQGHDGSVLIVLGPYWGGLLPAYAKVEVAGKIDNPYVMPFETGPIYVLRDPKVPFSFIWPRLKHYG
jgi:4-amino-4-deoxy-L-arabinose transferase-like glycosyltransferase